MTDHPLSQHEWDQLDREMDRLLDHYPPDHIAEALLRHIQKRAYAQGTKDTHEEDL